MKCPKCGFNSFEYYDSCKKCSNDLIGYKQTHSISSLVLPAEAKEKLIAESQSTQAESNNSEEVVEQHDDIFAFDLPEDTLVTPPQQNDDPFNFDEPVSETEVTKTAKSDDDVFADLLESTSQLDAASAPVVSPAATQSAPGEFDLENFSWDDTSATASKSVAPAPADDFDSFFDDKDNSSK